MMKLSEIVELFREVWVNIATERNPDLRTVAPVHMDEHTTLQTGPPVSQPGQHLLLRENDLAERGMVAKQLQSTGTRTYILGDSDRQEKCSVCGLPQPCQGASWPSLQS